MAATVVPLPVKLRVLLVVGVKVPETTKGVLVPDKVIVPVPVVKVAPAAMVATPVTLIVGLLVAPVAPAFVPSPMVKLLFTARVPELKTWADELEGFSSRL